MFAEPIILTQCNINDNAYLIQNISNYSFLFLIENKYLKRKICTTVKASTLVFHSHIHKWEGSTPNLGFWICLDILVFNELINFLCFTQVFTITHRDNTNEIKWTYFSISVAYYIWYFRWARGYTSEQFIYLLSF